MALLGQYAIVGELALDGSMRPVKGALSMAMAAAAGGKVRGLILPSANAAEAAVVDGVEVIAVDSLTQAAAFLIEHCQLNRRPCAWSNCSKSLAATKKTSPTYADRKWPNVP